MINQIELLQYAQLRSQYETLEEQFKAAKASLIKRVGTEHEEVEAGDLKLDLKTFQKDSTKYKEVVDGFVSEIQNQPELLEKVAELLRINTTTSTQNRLDVVREQVEVVKKVKKLKVA